MPGSRPVAPNGRSSFRSRSPPHRSRGRWISCSNPRNEILVAILVSTRTLLKTLEPTLVPTLLAMLTGCGGPANLGPSLHLAMRSLDRSLLGLLGLVLGTWVGAAPVRPASAQSPPGMVRPAEEAVDHLLLGAASLDDGIAWVEERTGVRPAPGGSHPGRGTRNALLSLGGRHYLEVIAPDPAQTATSDRLRDLRVLTHPRIFNWAVNTNEIDALAERLRARNLAATSVVPGSRRTLDGRTLAWKTLGVDSPAGPLAPFFIQWNAGVAHPSETSPAGCRLRAMRFEHPDPDMIRGALEQLGLRVNVVKAADPAIGVTLACSRGEIQLK